MKNLKWCSNCVAMSTRPRITFDENNLCNACNWSKQKKNYNWNSNLVKLKSREDWFNLYHRHLL